MKNPAPALPLRKQQSAMRLLNEVHRMLNDIAQGTAILGATPFAGKDAARNLATSLHTALLEFEIETADLSLHVSKTDDPQR